MIVALIVLYRSNNKVRNFFDLYLFNIDITDEDTSVIKLDSDKNNQVYVYGKNVAVLNDKNLILYDNYGQQNNSINININTALFNSNDKYLAIAENGGNEICLLLDKTYLWSNDLEGEITQIKVNSNGYVAVISSDSTRKSILTVFDSSGKKLFKSYFASTRIVDVSISDDNKYIAVAEIDTSGMIIKSSIKVVSVDNAQNNSENAIIYTYNAETNKLIISIEYQSKGQIACLYDDSIDIIKNKENNKVIDLKNEKITFASADFSNYMAYIEEENFALFKANSNVKIINTDNNLESNYTIESIVKNIYVQNDILAINAGAELYFLNTNGKLIKKYTGKKEITNVVLSKEIGAIIYKDKVILINL